jgi:hypothetical protein
VARQLQVLVTYTGRKTGEQRIYPGIYDEGDPNLFGLESYLADEQRKAVWLDASPTIPSAREYEEHRINLESDAIPDDSDDIEEGAGADDEDEDLQDDDGAPTSALDVLMARLNVDQAEELSVDIFRAEITRLELWDMVKATGKNGNAVKSDLVEALRQATAAG